MTSSLVEDMARALRVRSTGFDDWNALTKRTKDSYCADAEACLSVLKDRLPADDRELMERLRDYRGGTTEWRKLMDDAADRIIAYSADLGAGARAGQTNELCRHGKPWDEHCEGCGRIMGGFGMPGA